MEKELKITKEITPKDMSCVLGACPAIFETNNSSYAVIGKVLDAKNLGIENRLGKNEVLIEVPKKLIDKKISH
ncbi:MAG: hypothetical protein WC796_05080 [Candidatus Pacearchaeota archaeon]|jgi:hypothetical protein